LSKKQELLTNAAKIINEEGIQKFTMDYLAKKSGITKGGVLYHFDSKNKLLLEMNEMVIQIYEENIEHYRSQLSGSYLFTRAYALSTIYFLNNNENNLLPAVFISSHEDQKSQQLWQSVLAKWDQAFDHDQGDPDKILELRMICDGIWFSIMYNYENNLKDRMEQIVQQFCHSMEKEAF